MSKNKIYIIHEFNAWNHFKGLKYLLNERHIDYKFIIFGLTFREFLKSIYFLIIKHNSAPFVLFFKSLYYLFLLSFFEKDKKIIIGIAPYDLRLLLLWPIILKNKVFYFTSWTDWSGNFSPYKSPIFHKSVKKLWRNFIQNQVSEIFVVSNKSKHELMKYYTNVNPQVVNHSLEHKLFFYNQEKKRVQDQKKVNITYVGLLEKHKGILLFDNFIKSLSNSNINFSFTIVGQGSLRSIITFLETKHNNVKYLGYISDRKRLAEVYQSSDFLILPSQKQNNWEELFGMVIIEAMACGAIPIVSNHSGPKEIITNYKNGFLVDENNFVNEAIEIITNIINTKTITTYSSNAVKASNYYKESEVAKLWSYILD